MKFSAKTSPKEKSSGSKSSPGSSLQKGTWSYQEKTHTKTSSSSKDTWSQAISICIQTTEEPHPQSSRAIGKISKCLWILWSRQLFLLFADLKPGRRRLSPAPGGFILNKYQNQHRQASFCQLVHSWFEEREISFTPIEWKWEWLYCIRLTMSLHRDISMTGEFMRKRQRRRISSNCQ